FLNPPPLDSTLFPSRRSSDLNLVDGFFDGAVLERAQMRAAGPRCGNFQCIAFHLVVYVLHRPNHGGHQVGAAIAVVVLVGWRCRDRKSTRLNSSRLVISYAVF